MMRKFNHYCLPISESAEDGTFGGRGPEITSNNKKV